MKKDNFIVKVISGLIGVGIIGGLIVVVLTLKSLNKFVKTYGD